MPITASADIGPKPSVRIEFTGIEGETYSAHCCPNTTLQVLHLFGTEKPNTWFLAVINVITQVTLNVALNIVNYRSGSMNFTFKFVLYEILVFAIEAAAYAALLKKFSSKEQKKGSAAG